MFLYDIAEFQQKKEEREKYIVRRKGLYTDPIAAAATVGGLGAYIGGVAGTGIAGKSVIKNLKEKIVDQPGRAGKGSTLRYLNKLNNVTAKGNKIGLITGGLLGAGAGLGLAKLANKKNKQDKRKVTTADRLKSLATVGAIGAGAYALSRRKAKDLMETNPQIKQMLSQADDLADQYTSGIPHRTKARTRDMMQDFKEEAQKVRGKLDRQPTPNYDLPQLPGSGVNPVPKQNNVLTEESARQQLLDWGKERQQKIQNAQQRELNLANNYTKNTYKNTRRLLTGLGTATTLTGGANAYQYLQGRRKQSQDDKKAKINTRIGNARVIL